MKQLQGIAHDRSNMTTLLQLSSAFEGLASMRISRVKDEVLRAQTFFDELWNIYSQIRYDNQFNFGRRKSDKIIAKEVYIIITANGGFSGDIDQRLVSTMLEKYDNTKQDIIVIGRHGAVLLAQSGIRFARSFMLPEHDRNINVEPLVQEIHKYDKATVFYQAYVSLMVQEIRQINLRSAVKALGDQVEMGEEIITEKNYIFEPSAFDVIAHLERSIMQITIAQLILDSKLAQYASRFRAMSAAHDRAGNALDDINLLYARSRRSIRDEKLKQIINGLRQSKGSL